MSASARGRAPLDLGDRPSHASRSMSGGGHGGMTNCRPSSRTPAASPAYSVPSASRYDTWCHAWPGVGKHSSPTTRRRRRARSPRGRARARPRGVERVAVEPARARLELRGSTRCGAPTSETCTCRPGCSRTSDTRRTGVVEVDVREEEVRMSVSSRPCSARPAFRARRRSSARSRRERGRPPSRAR